MVHAGKALIVGLVYNAVRASAHGLRERAQAAHARRQGEGAKMRFGPGSRINRNSESGGSEILRSIITVSASWPDQLQLHTSAEDVEISTEDTGHLSK